MAELTAHQARQIEWLRRMEAREELGTGRRYEATCRDDGDSRVAYGADTIKPFIRQHAGHRTWIDLVR